MEIATRLKALPWFAPLDEPVLGALAARGRVLRRASGEWLWGEGDEETGIAAVLEGALYLYTQTADGGDVLFGALPVGGVVGQSILFGGGPRLVTAICAADSQLFALSDRALSQTAEEYTALWPALSALVFSQLRETVRLTAEFLTLSPRKRLISRLLLLSAPGARVLVSQAALAEMIGASRNAVNGWLAELEGAGAIARGYRHIDVVDSGRLVRLLAGGI